MPYLCFPRIRTDLVTIIIKTLWLIFYINENTVVKFLSFKSIVSLCDDSLKVLFKTQGEGKYSIFNLKNC